MGKKRQYRNHIKLLIMKAITDLTKYSKNEQYLYMLLSRMKMDCNFYLGYGNRNKKYLWGGSEEAHINEMKCIHNYLEKKPEWLTMSEIENFEKQFKL